jgi:hypothetical protein
MEDQIRQLTAQIAALNDTARSLLVAVIVGAFLVSVAFVYAARKVGALAGETKRANDSLGRYEKALAHDAANVVRQRARVPRA